MTKKKNSNSRVVRKKNSERKKKNHNPPRLQDKWSVPNLSLFFSCETLIIFLLILTQIFFKFRDFQYRILHLVYKTFIGPPKHVLRSVWILVRRLFTDWLVEIWTLTWPNTEWHYHVSVRVSPRRKKMQQTSTAYAHTVSV